MIDTETLKGMGQTVQAGLLAAVSAVIGYLVDVVHHERRFSWARWGVLAVLAFWVGQVLNDFLPEDMEGRGGVIALVGMSALPTYQLLKKNVPEIVAIVLNRVKDMARGGASPPKKNDD